MKKIGLALMGLAAAYFLAVALGVEAPAATSTQHFIQSASIANQFEISSSRVALQKSQNDDVKRFAQKMVDDHTQIGSWMKQIIASENLSVSPPSPALDPRHQKLLDKLNDAPVQDFDRKYVQDQIEGHKEAVGLFSDYAQNGDDAGLKDFAAKTLPAIRRHLRHAKEL